MVLDQADTSGIDLLDGGFCLNRSSSACALTWYDGYADALMIDVCIVSGIPPHAGFALTALATCPPLVIGQCTFSNLRSIEFPAP